jgi:hypothetical protein
MISISSFFCFFSETDGNPKRSVFTEEGASRDHSVRCRFICYKVRLIMFSCSSFKTCILTTTNLVLIPVAPMRGRGIARGMMGASGRMDSFRTRTPNTSRPPSMHVDDFMKLEKGQDDRDPNAVSPIRRVDSIIQRVIPVQIVVNSISHKGSTSEDRFKLLICKNNTA